MPVKIYNTLTRKKEELRPLEEGHVKLYVCGITSYDYCHIGHARSALVFDMVVRYLRYRGYRVTFVRNFTDIDDKIIRRAAEQGVEASDLAQRFIDEFYTDMDHLGVLRPDIEPRATEHIPEMIALIEELIERGLAYASGGDVYFRVGRFPDYGQLSGRSLEDMQAGARIEVNDQKEHPMDFVLWKASKPGEPKWDSPWGEGRPGWHIECSAMSRKYLGETFDIHGGGKDLIFPHHENEIAQSMGATGKPFANLWMHHGFVTIKDEKMSKSLGNFLTIRDVLAAYAPEVLRLFIFSTQYRNPLDFTEAAMRDAESGLARMYECLARINALADGSPEAETVIGKKDRQKLASLRQRFEYAMDNDFNTAQAVGLLFDAVKTLNKITRALPASPAEDDVATLRRAAADLRELGGILGLLGQDPADYVAARKQALLDKLDISDEEIEELIARRSEARKNRDWATSDAIRDKLLGHGIELQDSQDGTTWDVTL
ncbi:cysteine--tRNA ligase [Desulfolithobacter dissulfuricans]|uniref:Cysteine--tRNA ligase n=1 Tax=Desulfolithobacter dissulfuricans TaxID=2795293 RepID=A0A915U8U3_9BACT|nr:cysteine--tRNA ligase [Desulfolithobacter dissulfuricans]BCO08346.1 cysteine--tRNA ligase [Desulfolithobacter dissulfuricans]